MYMLCVRVSLCVPICVYSVCCYVWVCLSVLPFVVSFVGSFCRPLPPRVSLLRPDRTRSDAHSQRATPRKKNNSQHTGRERKKETNKQFKR